MVVEIFVKVMALPPLDVIDVKIAKTAMTSVSIIDTWIDTDVNPTLCEAMTRLSHVSLKTVAERAGVSTITASRALRGMPIVNEKTRQHIAEIAASLGYVPNRIASSLRSQRSGLVAVIVPTVAGSIFAETVGAISRRLDGTGYQAIIGESTYDIAQEQAVLESLVQRRPDAIIVAGTNHTPATRRLLETLGIPVVEIWELADDPVDSVVGFSNFHAAFDFTRALIDKGYRRFAMASGPLEHENRASLRVAGHYRALAEAGLEPGPAVVIPHFLGILRSGQSLLEFIRSHPDVDCLFCTNELIAIGATVQCQRAGIAIPKDLAIVGFGDVEACSIIEPPLTTVHINGAEMGRNAAQLVLDRLAGRGSAGVQIDVRYSFQWRATA
jgi:LacI family gluconate utilization system Gnt-I transcriptional repressor